MPIYTYKCPECGASADSYRQMAQRNQPLPCPQCPESFMLRDMGLEGAHTDRGYAKPVLSDAMGCHPGQVAEHRRLFPDVPITGDGRVVVTSHQEHRRIMKRLGFHDKAGYS